MSELETLISKLNVRCESTYFGWVSDWNGGRGATRYTVKLRIGKRQLSVPFYCGSAYGEPKAADVLHCLVSDARAGECSFEDFCSEFGYDEDSRKAEAAWKACKAIAPKIRRFLGDNFDAVANAEH